MKPLEKDLSVRANGWEWLKFFLQYLPFPSYRGPPVSQSPPLPPSATSCSSDVCVPSLGLRFKASRRPAAIDGEEPTSRQPWKGGLVTQDHLSARIGFFEAGAQWSLVWGHCRARTTTAAPCPAAEATAAACVAAAGLVVWLGHSL